MTLFRTNPLKHISEMQHEILAVLNEIRLRPEEDFLVDSKKAAQFLGVHKATLARHVKEGKIPAVTSGKEIKFWNKDLIAYLKPVTPIKK